MQVYMHQLVWRGDIYIELQTGKRRIPLLDGKTGKPMWFKLNALRGILIGDAMADMMRAYYFIAQGEDDDD